jgi:chaperone required for assembly of F1-ATPase
MNTKTFSLAVLGFVMTATTSSICGIMQLAEAQEQSQAAVQYCFAFSSTGF